MWSCKDNIVKEKYKFVYYCSCVPLVFILILLLLMTPEMLSLSYKKSNRAKKQQQTFFNYRNSWSELIQGQSKWSDVDVDFDFGFTWPFVWSLCSWVDDYIFIATIIQELIFLANFAGHCWPNIVALLWHAKMNLGILP